MPATFYLQKISLHQNSEFFCFISSMAERKNVYAVYTPEFKRKVVLEYAKGVRGKGYGALAARFKLDGGKTLVKSWVKAYDGTDASLAKLHSGGTEPVLSEEEADILVRDFIEARAATGLHTGIDELFHNIQKNTGLELSPSTIAKYMSNYGASKHRVHKQSISQGRERI
jgi:transposase